MKYLFSSIMIVMTSALLMLACRKEPEAIAATPVLTADSLIYNTATNGFTPNPTISGTIEAPGGIQLIYYYLVRENQPDSLLYRDFTTPDNQNNFSFSIPSSVLDGLDLSHVEGVKLMAKLLDNSSFEGFIKISPFTPPLPEFRNFADTLEPDLNGGITVIEGDVHSESGLKTILIEDDYQGDFAPVDSITDLNGATDYSLSYDYRYRNYAARIRVTAVDIYGLSTSHTITMPVLPYDIYKNVTMMGQGTSSVSSGTAFFMEDASLMGTCEISGHDAEILFLAYTNTSPAMYFYSPTNTANVAKNYKCDGQSWVPNAAVLRPTRFRVLVPGSNATDAVYAAYNANNIPTLDDSFFAGIATPSASAPKYVPAESSASASQFNTTSAYLIWATLPQADGSIMNALIRVNEVNLNTDAGSQGLSTINFDIYIQH